MYRTGDIVTRLQVREISKGESTGGVQKEERSASDDRMSIVVVTPSVPLSVLLGGER